MNSYLINYVYPNDSGGAMFSAIIEAENFKDAHVIYAKDGGMGTVVGIKQLNTKLENCIVATRCRDAYPKIVDVRLVINNNRDTNDLVGQIAEVTGFKNGIDPFGIYECVFVISEEKEHGKGKR